MSNFQALLVGIDYLGTENQLNGCGNDVRDMSEILRTEGHFNTTILTDVKDLTYSNGQSVHVAGLPNKDVILSELKRMIANSQPGDTLLIYNSSHGTQIPSALGTSEQDFIVALDAVTGGFDQSKLISSKELHDALIQVPQGVKLLMVADSCFSGNITEFDKTARGLTAKKVTSPFQHLRALIEAHHRSESSHGALTLIAGCKSTQESTDLGTNGALTAAIKQWIAQNKLSQFLAACWDYSTSALSDLKAALTKTIQDAGVTDQDPQISYDRDTGIPAPTPTHTSTPAHAHHRPHRLSDFIHELEEFFEGRSSDTVASTSSDADPALLSAKTLIRSPHLQRKPAAPAVATSAAASNEPEAHADAQHKLADTKKGKERKSRI